MRCSICYNILSEVRKASRNGQVPISQSTRCDEAKAVKSIIDYLIGLVVSAAVAADNTKKLWNSLHARMTELMTDILRQFETMRKEAQSNLIPFPGLLFKREQVLGGYGGCCRHGSCHWRHFVRGTKIGKITFVTYSFGNKSLFFDLQFLQILFCVTHERRYLLVLFRVSIFTPVFWLSPVKKWYCSCTRSLLLPSKLNVIHIKRNYYRL